MEEIGKKLNIVGGFSKNAVHYVLAHSYSFYFLMFLLGVFMNIFYPIRIFESYYMSTTGFVILVLGTVLIVWAQNTSRDLNTTNLSKDIFYQGPYRYTRGPTHLGLFLLILGFGIIANSVYIVIFSIISFLVGKFFFLKKEEEILATKYGTPYIEYKKIVRF
jgi:protein-S-isoprenylcysteine O-methyltransferase Ste14